MAKIGTALIMAALVGMAVAASGVAAAQSPDSPGANLPGADYHEVAAAVAESQVGYIVAIAESRRRYLAAEAAGDRDAMSGQLTAFRLYTARLAEVELQRADAFQQAADALPEDDPERDYLLGRAVLHREMADHAARMAEIDGVPAGGQPLVSAYTVGNPTDRDANVDLRIRRVSIPPHWELSIVDAQGQGQEEAEPLVQEVAAGEHYRVRLPAAGETRVASVLVPVGPVGQNTTARWAVEGMIGDELIGGMMHEMHVPAVLEDLELPPVATAAVAADVTAPEGRLAMLLVGGALVVSVIVAVILVLRVRKSKGGAS